ncbi:hypothetical protein EON65_40445 [archaeon]|nr:MAG: hypothetical protein EON65_40445 [archaeon]
MAIEREQGGGERKKMWKARGSNSADFSPQLFVLLASMSSSFKSSSEAASLLASPGTEITFQAILQLIKLANIVFAIVAGSIQFYYGYHESFVEYVQIGFLSVTICIIDSEPGYIRCLLIVLFCVFSITWLLDVILIVTWDSPVVEIVLIAIDNALYTSGALASAIVIVNRPVTREIPTVSFIDLDLLVYLMALNLLCINPVASFNLGLHMIMDIRLTVLLFVGLYRPVDKIQLLHDNSFVIALISIVAFFLIYKASNSYIIRSVAFVVNSVLGVVWHWQAYYHYTVVYPKLRQRSDRDATMSDDILMRQ